MVDEERVSRLISRVRDDIAALRATRQTRAAPDLTKDTTTLDALKYRFVTAIEGCVRVAQHLLASEGWAIPETNADAFRQLAKHDVLDAQVAESMARAVGFRNVLVHEYADVDDDRVVAQLDHLDDLEGFTRQVTRWTLAQRS
ncbi:MAG: type VII toxin-antitoxin system HepT family RNase toxin [Streptosporangiales bacterium]